MLVQHFSRELRYRDPFGARPCGTEVDLRLAVSGGDLDRVELHYIYGLNNYQYSFAPLKGDEQGDETIYSLPLPLPLERGLVFYWFKLVDVNGEISYFIKDDQSYRGGGILVTEPPMYSDNSLPYPLTWQITVYKEDFAVPEWFQGGVIYQIFPDRYRRGADYSFEKMLAEGDSSERIYHADWQEEVDIEGRPHTGYMACDFYGGTLQGITEKLDYIKSFGTDVIYLNPIFRARSNHRYDTGDYFAVDPLLGTLEDFRTLCQEAEKREIKIILDGVFSHTGADSKYFNLYGRYDTVGAWQAATTGAYSEFSSWYRFDHAAEPPTYESWWGFKDLPNVHENDLHYTDFILGEKGVVKFWLDQGVSGFRLDVSDELPDEFLRNFRRRLKKYNPEAILLGEVWEDPSNKISYGHLRDFMFGTTHDSVMGYPFRKAVLEWLLGDISAEICADQLLSLQENFPPAAIYSNMNLLSTHDTVRATTALAELPDPGKREEQIKTALSDKQRALGEKRLLLATLLQIALPGMTSIYYGDEYAAEGFRDPFNRRTFREDLTDSDFTREFRKIIAFKQQYAVLCSGKCELISAKGDVLVWRRFSKEFEQDKGETASGGKIDGVQEVVVAINRANYPQAFYWQHRDYVLNPLGAKIMVDDELVYEID